MTDAHYGLARQLGPLRERAPEVGRVGHETAATSVGANGGPPLAYGYGDRAGSEAQRGMGRRDPQDLFYSCGQESVSAFVNANILVRHLTGTPPDFAAMSLLPGCRCTSHDPSDVLSGIGNGKCLESTPPSRGSRGPGAQSLSSEKARLRHVG